MSAQRINVLTLDGGGVRGLSTLLILQALMLHINQAIKTTIPEHDDIQPHEIFDMVAGTSTGGLIALMLGKLGMTVDECIVAYGQLSKKIFEKKHIRGALTSGLDTSRYSGTKLRERIRQLMKSKGKDMEMCLATEGSDAIACALVCREHESESRYSKLKRRPVLLCSLPCPDNLEECLVCDAARATSAAPTYFAAQKINGRIFVDGGFEFNNPSRALFDHCTIDSRRIESQKPSLLSNAIPTPTLIHHRGLDFYQARIINLGTGTTPDDPTLAPRNQFAAILPPALRFLLFWSGEMKALAVDSERIADEMRSLGGPNGHFRKGPYANFRYERFSANNGVCFIKLDKWKKLEEIKTLTLEYLEVAEVKQNLLQVAKEMATEYLNGLEVKRIPAILSQHLVTNNVRNERPRTPQHNIYSSARPSCETHLSPNSSGKSNSITCGGSIHNPSTKATSIAPSSGNDRKSCEE